MAEDCIDCAYWRQQSGSAHVLCPIYPDFRLAEGVRCELFKQASHTEDRKCNAFLVWAGARPEGWPSQEEINNVKAKARGWQNCKVCGRLAPLIEGECPDCRH